MALDLSQSWLKQAEHDLEVAAHLRSKGYFDWACFAAQQAAEKALKSVRTCLGCVPKALMTHDLGRLADRLPGLTCNDDRQRRERFAALASHEGNARYPGAAGEDIGVPPCERYDDPMAEGAVEEATKIVDECRKLRLKIEESGSTV